MVKTLANAGFAFAACTRPRATAAISAGGAAVGLQLVFEPGAGAEPDDRRQVERNHDRRRQFGEHRVADGRERPRRSSRMCVRSANGVRVTKNIALLLCAMPSSMLKPTIEVIVATPGVARTMRSTSWRRPMCG